MTGKVDDSIRGCGEFCFGNVKLSTPCGVIRILSRKSSKQFDICCFLNVELRGPRSCCTAKKFNTY